MGERNRELFRSKLSVCFLVCPSTVRYYISVILITVYYLLFAPNDLAVYTNYFFARLSIAKILSCRFEQRLY